METHVGREGVHPGLHAAGLRSECQGKDRQLPPTVDESDGQVDAFCVFGLVFNRVVSG